MTTTTKTSTILIPHEVPIEQNTFVSTYDHYYQRKRFGRELPKRDVMTGYLKNSDIPFRSLPFGDTLSTNHDEYRIRDAVCTHPTSSKTLTAHVRNQSHLNTHGPAAPMITTMKRDYTPPGAVDGGLPFRYAGDAARRFNPDFLRIDGRDGKEKSKEEPPSPPTKWRSRRDGLHVNPHSKLDVYSPPRFRPMTVHGNPDLLKRKGEPTAASKMGGLTSNAGLLDAPFEGTTTYRHFMVNQWKLPEPVDPTRWRGKKEDLIRLDQYKVSYQSADALGTIRGDNGRLVEVKPEKVHPSIWSLEMAKERSRI